MTHEYYEYCIGGGPRFAWRRTGAQRPRNHPFPQKAVDVLHFKSLSCLATAFGTNGVKHRHVIDSVRDE